MNEWQPAVPPAVLPAAPPVAPPTKERIAANPDPSIQGRPPRLSSLNNGNAKRSIPWIVMARAFCFSVLYLTKFSDPSTTHRPLAEPWGRPSPATRPLPRRSRSQPRVRLRRPQRPHPRPLRALASPPRSRRGSQGGRNAVNGRASSRLNTCDVRGGCVIM